MNRLYNATLVLLCGAFVLTTAAAQTSNSESTSNDQHEGLAQRIGVMVEDVINKLEKELSGRGREIAMKQNGLKQVLPKQALPDEIALQDMEDSSITYQGNTVIQRGDTVNSNVVVKAGNLTVYGRINGDVLVVGGDLYLRDGSYISGNVKVINGEVEKDDDAVVAGFIDKGSSKREKTYREEEKNFRKSSTKLNANWVSETTNLDNFIFRYNRVEGLFLGLGSDKRYYWDDQRSYSLYGSAGYGFKSHNWRGNLGLSRQFAFDDGQLFEIEVEGHTLTDTKDDWLIGVHENTAAAILIHEDFRDYFRRDGIGVNAGYAAQKEYVTGQVKVGYLADKYESMENRTEWSVFGGDKRFRPNPAIDEGKMRSIVASAGLSTVTTTIYGPEGWSILTTAEFADKSLKSDFNFNRYVADVRRYQPLSRYDNLNVRVRVGSAEGALPLQKTFEIGGLGTLQGYPFKGEAGNRMILMNAELIVNGDFLGDLSFWPSWIMKGINLLVLTDAGLVRTVDTQASWTDGYGGIQFSEFRHDVGAGVATRSGSFRAAFVWRTDRIEPAHFIFRFSRPF
jgi:hypothetical protein